MSTSAVTPITTAQAQAQAAAQQAASNTINQDLNANTFLKMFTSEIANQDPTNPMQSSDFLNQFSQITQVQTVTQLNQTLGSLGTAMTSMTNTNQLTQASSLIGKTVNYLDTSGNPGSGAVSSVNVGSDGSVSLVVNGNPIGLSTITSIH